MSILSILLMNIHFIYVCLNASWFHCFWNSKEYVDKTEAIREEHKRTSIWSKQRISLWRIQTLFGCPWTLWYNSVIKWRNKILLDETRHILSGLSFTFFIPDTSIWNYKVLLNLVSSISVSTTPRNYEIVTNMVWDTFVFGVY